MNHSNIKLGVLGFGNMAQAIVTGLISSKLLSTKNIYALEPDKIRVKNVKKKYKIRFLESSRALSHQSSVILICVKPQDLKTVLTQLKPHYKNQLVMTVVTGATIKKYKKYLGSKSKIIRIMPNTPALIGYGAAAYFVDQNCTQRDKKLCENFFNCIGTIIKIKKESLMNAITAICGSGPAFVYQYAQSVINSAKKLGIQENTAKKLVLQTMLGATQMMIKSSQSPDQLTKLVTSKRGTTLAGLEALNKKGFTKAIEACMIRATKRAIELSKLL